MQTSMLLFELVCVFKVQAHFYFEYCVHVQENSNNIKDFHTSIQS